MLLLRIQSRSDGQATGLKKTLTLNRGLTECAIGKELAHCIGTEVGIFIASTGTTLSNLSGVKHVGDVDGLRFGFFGLGNDALVSHDGKDDITALLRGLGVLKGVVLNRGLDEAG